MKKILAIAVVAIISVVTLSSFTVSSSEKNVSTIETSSDVKAITCYSGPQTTSTFYHSDGKIYEGASCHETSKIGTYNDNPYYNETKCDPGDKWCTCFKYVFNYKGTTYYFNLN